jgi:hypothetical protein
MRDYSYFFENLDLINLFISAFDDAFVFRYDANSRNVKERIDVRYIHGPKHRVLYDLTDRAKTLTLPVVTIEQSSLTRDMSRISNKGQHFYRPGGEDNKISKIPTPIPVNLELNLSIIAYFKEDVDQIIQNFVVNCNPYIIVSWKIPEEFGMPFLDEIRTEIQWSGNISYNNPKDLSPDTKWRISADTTFTVKGWMFKSLNRPQEPIYTVKTDFRTFSLKDKIYTYDNYSKLSSISLSMDTIMVSAYPQFSNLFYAYQGISLPIKDNFVINGGNDNSFLVYGKRFSYSNSWYLSSGVDDFYTNFELVSTARYPLISAYNITEWVNVESDNVARITIPAEELSVIGEFKLITANEAGWASSPDTILYNWREGGLLSYDDTVLSIN